jgi:AraC-like DNA-binding protein
MREYRIEAEQEPIARTGIEFFYYDFQNRKKQVSPHIHTAVELLYIKRGKFQIFADNREFLVSEGDTVLFRSNTIHRIYAQEGGDVGYYVFKFSPAFLLGLAAPENRGLYLLELALDKKDGRLVWSAEQGVQNGLASAFSCLIDASEHPSGAADIAMKVGASSVILSLLRDLLDEGSSAPAGELPGEEAMRRIYDVTVYVNEHYADPITAAECAAMAYMSYSYFSRCFYRVTGKSFKEYLNVTRINRAEKAILSSEKSITEIAGDCGFNSVSYFISTYKRIKGTTPLALRTRKG